MRARPVRVALVADSMTRPEFGTGSYMHYLVRSLLRTRPPDIELHLAFAHATPPALPPGTNVLRLSRLPGVRDRQLSAFDVILLNGMDWRSPVYLNRRPVVAVTHGGWELVHRRPLRGYLEKRFLRPLLLRRARTNVTVSASSKALLENAWPNPRFEVVLNGVDHERFRPTPAGGAFEVSGRTLVPGQYLFHLSRYVPRKNASDLLRVFRTYADRHPESPVRLVIAGKGWQGAVDDLARTRGIRKDDIDCLGFVAEDDLPRLYSNALAFLFFSTYEGFGLPVVEAMACGCPVLVNRAFSLEEVAPPDSLFDLGSPAEEEQLVERIERLHDRPEERARMSALSLAAAQKFSWDDAAQRFIEMFRACARA